MARRLAAFVATILVLAGIAGAVLATLLGKVEWGDLALLLLAIPVLLVALWLLTVLGRRTWGPVRDLIRAAGRLADGDYTVRVDSRSAAGMGGVVASFNTMAERLEDSDDQRRRLMSDLGHELRTPLAVIRGEIEAVIDGVRDGGPEHMASLLDEVETMERLVEDLRVLTLSEAGRLPLQLESADLGSVVREVAASYRATAQSAGVQIEVEGPAEPVEVDFDIVRIRQALTNLVVNALRAMPDGGEVSILVIPGPDRVVVEVADTGPGISPDDLPAVFDRFVKSEDSPGSGLGLSIARGLLRAHGGDLEITRSDPSGTTATLWLPR